MPYLLRLEQLLAVRGANLDKVPANFLTGVREILDGHLQLCLNHPNNTVVRLVLIETLRRMKKSQPQVVDAYRDKVRLLQKEKPLPTTAHAVAERMLQDVYT